MIGYFIIFLNIFKESIFPPGIVIDSQLFPDLENANKFSLNVLDA